MISNPNKLRIALAALAASSFMAVTPMVGATPPDQDHKVTICHRTNSNTNPYVLITVDKSAVDGVGGSDHYGEHQGPVWDPTLKDRKIEWGDIIPPVPPHHNGLNWTPEGRAIYDRKCETGNTTTSTTTTAPPTTTTTTAPSTTTTVVTPTTMVTPPTTAPTTTTVPGSSTTTTSFDTSPTLIPPTVIERDARTSGTLPETGMSNTDVLALIAFVLLLLGALILSSRPHD